jgi:hypothetical protein
MEGGEKLDEEGYRINSVINVVGCIRSWLQAC